MPVSEYDRKDRIQKNLGHRPIDLH